MTTIIHRRIWNKGKNNEETFNNKTDQLIRSFKVIRIEWAGLTMSNISFWTLLNGGISVTGLVDNACTNPFLEIERFNCKF